MTQGPGQEGEQFRLPYFRTMKHLLKILLLLLCLLLAGGGGYLYVRQKFQPAANQLVVPYLPLVSPFVWKADSAARPVVPHAALLVPVTLPGCPRRCLLQFDTGAPSSVLYAHPLAALRARYPGLRQQMRPRADTVANVQLRLGGQPLQAHWLRLLPVGDRRLPPADSTPVVIGTLGADLLDGRVMVLDYPRQRFTLCAHVPDSLARRTRFAPLVFDSRRVLLSAHVQGQEHQLLFDSGSSAFALLTSQDTWNRLRQPHALPCETTVNSWGRQLTAHTVATPATLGLGPATVPLVTVTYIEGTAFWQSVLMRFSGMGGMLGNAPFVGSIVILDVPGHRFGVARP